MAIEIKTVRRAYAADKKHQQGIHTAYTAAPGIPEDPTKPQSLMRLDFVFGVARDVPQNVFDAFKAVGIVTDERPKRGWDDD